MQLEIEAAALEKEKDNASRERLNNLLKELQDLKSESGAMQARWQAEKQSILRIQNIKKEIDECRTEMERAERELSLIHIFLPLHDPFFLLAEPTGFEPAIFGLTGRYAKPLHHGSAN